MHGTNGKFTIFVAGVSLLAFAVALYPVGAAAQTSPLQSLQEKCAPWDNFPKPKAAVTATWPEYKAWLREFAKRNPHKTWQQIITFLHRDHQTGDEGLWLPGVGNTFVNGPENPDWRSTDFDTACYADTPVGRKENVTPYRVVDDLGRTIDVTHIYAGIRSDFNRKKDSWKAGLVRRMNTDWGDHFQDLVMPNAWSWTSWTSLPEWVGGYAPPDQLLGDAMGLWAANKFQNFGGGPQSWADVILSAIEHSVREEELRRDVADLLPSEDFLPDERKTADEKEEEEKQKVARAKERERKDALCDVSKNSPPESNMGPEWIPQETAAEAPNYVDREECRPFGPPAKRFQYIVADESDSDAGEPKKERTIARVIDRCPHLADTVDAAGAQYTRGKIDTARTTLKGVLAELNAGRGTAACPDMRARVVANIAKVTRMTNVLADLEESLTECAPQPLRRHREQLVKAKHVSLVSARERLHRAMPVAKDYTQAVVAFKQGRIDDAAFLFRSALAAAKTTGKPTCVDIESRTRGNLGRIAQMKDVEKVVASALDSCDLTAIERRKSALVGTTNPFLVSLHARLSDAPSVCRQRLADENCDAKFGSGWTGGPPDDNGDFYCRPPNKAAANRWCEDNSEGSGWVAGKIAASGAFECLPTYARQKRAAQADCRRQHGKRLIKVYRHKGEWYCNYRTKTAKGKKKRPRRAARRQGGGGGGGYDPRAAAAAAAIAGAVIQGIVRSQGGGGGGGCANPRAPGC